MSSSSTPSLSAPAPPEPGRPLPAGSAPVVLVVDDGEANRELIEAYLARIQCDVISIADGPTALSVMETVRPDVVLLDMEMPVMGGLEVCQRIKANPRLRLVPVVIITAWGRTEDRVKALEWGADDFMAKPVERAELVARVRSCLRVSALHETLDSAEEVIFALAAAVEAKDALTEKHTRRVADSARHVGECLGLPQAALDSLYRGGLIHDIGKIGVSEAILLKNGPLDFSELEKIRAHTTIGANIVAPLRSGSSLLPIIRHHHERLDGHGYPDGLHGTQIPLLARIISICDAFDAMVSHRPYRSGLRVDEAVKTYARARARSGIKTSSRFSSTSGPRC